MKRRFDSIWFPEKDWNVCIWVHAYDVSLPTVYWEVLTENSYFTNSPWLIAVMPQSNGGFWLTTCETEGKGSVLLVNAGWRKVEGKALVSVWGAGFASWLANTRLSSCLEWSGACLTPAPQARRPVPNPNLSWHWSHQTSRASCRLQSDKQDHHITSFTTVLIKEQDQSLKSFQKLKSKNCES